MAENRNNNYPEEENLLDLSTLLNILLGKWYWFAGSILLALLLGCAYLYRAPKVYRKQATILVKEEKNGMGGVSQATAFADIAGVSGLAVSNTENELLILKSRSLMEEVVYRLGAHISYYHSELFRSRELYSNTPFRVVEQERGTLMPASLVVTPVSNTDFRAEITYYAADKAEMTDTLLTGRFNEVIQFPFGIATLQASDQLLPYFIGKPIEVTISTPKRVASAYLANLQVSLMSKNASLLSLSFTGSTPRKAEDVLNTLLDQYNLDAISDKNKVLDHTNTFIQERLMVIRRELDEVDGRIEGYKRSTLSTNIQAESQVYLQRATNLEEKISAIDIQLNLVSILGDFLSQPNNERELLPYNIGLDNAGLNQQIQNFNDNMIRLNRMVAASSERNPVVVDLSASLASARISIEKTVAEMKRSLQLQQRELAQRNHRTTNRIEAVATNERSVQSITRDQQIKAELYLYLLNKSEENAIVKSTTEPNARIIDAAYGGDMPIAPRTMTILLACLLIGAVLPGAWFILKDLLFTKVRGRSDVAKVVHAPILGEIPSKSKTQQTETILVRPGSTNQVSEAFRILRTNLSFFNTGSSNQVIAVTSSQPGEGKTYVSMNLAMTLALTGKKVCVIDLDLRRASLSKALQMRGKTGVTEYLAGQVDDLSSIVRSVPNSESLFVLPAGTVPPNPAELLMQERYEQLIAALRTRFDYILLDNSPLPVVADAKIANRCADLTAYVVRAGVLDRRELSAIEALYQEQTLNNMGVLITDVDYERLYYSVGYKGYGKGYGYRYGEYGKGYYN